MLCQVQHASGLLSLNPLTPLPTDHVTTRTLVQPIQRRRKGRKSKITEDVREEGRVIGGDKHTVRVTAGSMREHSLVCV